MVTAAPTCKKESNKPVIKPSKEKPKSLEKTEKNPKPSNNQKKTALETRGDLSTYKAAALKVNFSLFYPGYLPQGFKLVNHRLTPTQVLNNGGYFEAVYSHGKDKLLLGQGSFDAGEAEFVKIENLKVAGLDATLSQFKPGQEADFRLSWAIKDSNYAFEISGISKVEVLKMAKNFVKI